MTYKFCKTYDYSLYSFQFHSCILDTVSPLRLIKSVASRYDISIRHISSQDDSLCILNIMFSHRFSNLFLSISQSHFCQIYFSSIYNRHIYLRFLQHIYLFLCHISFRITLEKAKYAHREHLLTSCNFNLGIKVPL